jgi:hypothetical protein
MAMRVKNQAAEKELLTQLVSGTNLHITTPISLAGQTYTSAEIVAVFTAAAGAYVATDAARAELHAKLLDQEAKVSAALSLEALLKAYVHGVYGRTSPILLEFGWSVAKVAVRTAAEKAATVAKMLATRTARHTLGKKQKAKIVGTVPASPAAPNPPVVTSGGATPTK